MAKLPWLPGFRFHPTDAELLCFYLKRKVCGRLIKPDVICELDIYKFSPWDLPGKSCLQSGDLEWYFYCPRDKKYANGPRMNRSTEIGYWKTTGKDRPIYNNHQLVGMKRTLVFYIGKPPHGERTNWVMHEYRLQDKSITEETIQDAFVLCRVKEKGGVGPRNGEQYGAPFEDEEWSKDFVENSTELCGSKDQKIPFAQVIEHPSSSMNEGNFSSGVPKDSNFSFASGDVLASQENTSMKSDGIEKVLHKFAVEGDNSVAPSCHDGQPSSKDNVGGEESLNGPVGNASANASSIVSDIYSGLEDITTLMDVGRVDAANNLDSLNGVEGHKLYRWFDAIKEGCFLEVNDLKPPLDEGSSMLQTSTNLSCVSEDPQGPLISSNLNGTTTSAQVENILSSMLDAELSSGYIAEDCCTGTHNQIISQAPSASLGHVVEEVGDAPAWDFSRGEGHGNGDVTNDLSDGGLLHSVLESILDCFPARPASAAQYPLLSKEGKLKGNVSTCNCTFLSTVMNKHTGVVEGGSQCFDCCRMMNLKKPTRKGGKETGSGMSWRGLLFVFLVSSISVLLWILLILLGLKFTRHAWKLMFAR
ncbi:NAC domain-containing protein 78-like isoform X1 [Nymphaea colorata]|nr:NAC domain-containing protein 78-like isoform X1 [Nymphaea colorata]XP_049937200.1 NAC domain-containing protein 78-like isoform X1 [Nymphaea colorata]